MKRATPSSPASGRPARSRGEDERRNRRERDASAQDSRADQPIPVAPEPTSKLDVAPCHCGSPMFHCAACGAPRCVTCEPVSSDDCMWQV